MHKPQQLLLAMLALFFTHTLLAQVSIDIKVEGVDSELEKNIRLYLSLEQQKAYTLLSEERIRRLHKKSPLEIEQALQPFGYYRPKINSQLTQLDADQWQAHYIVDHGEPLPIKSFKLLLSEDILQDLEFKPLIETPSLKPGDTFNHIIYDEFKSNLAKLAAERGYFAARFIEHKVEIDLKNYEANVLLNFDGGKRYRFGEITLEQDVLDDDLLQRYISFERGSDYSIYELLKLHQSLVDSGYFQNIEVSPHEPETNNPQADNEIPVDIKLTPRKRHRYSLGIGYGTDTGARARASWAIPRVNRSGHRMNTDLMVSEIGYKAGFRYRIPVFNPQTDELVFGAGVINEETDTSESTISTIATSLNHNRGQWRESISLSYQQEDYIVADDEGSSILLIPSVNWTRIWGDDFIYTVDGLRFDISLRGASKQLISDTDFTQLQGGIKAINKMGQSNRLITRGRLGTTWTDEFYQLPASVRFFTGGAKSVRGYSYQSLGPVNAIGEVVGGKHLMIGSIEFEHFLSEKWGLAVFYDAGNAIDSFNDDLKRGAGLGFRWNSPIGAVRFDVASAISEEDKPWRIHFNIGPDL